MGEFRVIVSLKLDVDEDDLLFAIPPPDFHQLVDDAPACLRISDDLRKLLVKALEAAAPVDLVVNRREKESEETQGER